MNPFLSSSQRVFTPHNQNMSLQLDSLSSHSKTICKVLGADEISPYHHSNRIICILMGNDGKPSIPTTHSCQHVLWKLPEIAMSRHYKAI